MKVVVVDDDVSVLQLVGHVLKQAGHDIVTFSDPREAVRSLPLDSDLVLSDLRMPGLNGLEVANEVARLLGASPPRTLLMTGYEVQLRNGLPERDPVIGMLRKPFMPDRLLAIMDVVARTRDICPGLVYRELQCPVSPEHGNRSPHANGHCRSAEYALCPGYADETGGRLQDWIASVEMLPLTRLYT